MLKYTIVNRTNQPINFISSEIHKLIVFEYLIPIPMFPPVKRMSRIYLLEKETKVGDLNLKYILFNSVVCWLGMPFGPIKMLAANKRNKQGIDLTKDLLKHVTTDSMEKRFIEVPIYYSEFLALEKPIAKALKTVFDECNLSDQVKIGYVKFKRKHIFYVGINKSELKRVEGLKKKLSVNFDSRSVFKFHDLQLNDELAKKLKEEGKLIL